MASEDSFTTGSPPPYKRIAERLRRAILRGDYRPGDSLPSIRQLAIEERVNPNTIQSAYRLLESEGWVDRRQGAGVFVRMAEQLATGHRQTIMRRSIASARAEAKRMDGTEEEWKDAERRARLRIPLTSTRKKAS